MLNYPQLRAELALRGLAQWRLAKKIGYPPSTFSDYVRGARPAPADLVSRIERVLGLRPKSLRASESQGDGSQ